MHQKHAEHVLSSVFGPEPQRPRSLFHGLPRLPELELIENHAHFRSGTRHVSFDLPAAPSSRPRSRDGAVPIHFHHSYFTRGYRAVAAKHKKLKAPNRSRPPN